MNEVIVRRSAWKMWRVSILSIPFIILAVDVLSQRRLTNAFREALFRPDDTQLFEFRDVVWAWVILAAAGSLAVWALRELIVPTKLIEAGSSGIRLQVTAPFRRPLFVAWSDIDDIGSARVDDEGEVLSVLWLRFVSTEIGPEDPWSARWMDDTTLAVLASEWESDPIDVARQLTDLALDVARAEQAEALAGAEHAALDEAAEDVSDADDEPGHSIDAAEESA